MNRSRIKKAKTMKEELQKVIREANNFGSEEETEAFRLGAMRAWKTRDKYDDDWNLVEPNRGQRWKVYLVADPSTPKKPMGGVILNYKRYSYVVKNQITEIGNKVYIVEITALTDDSEKKYPIKPIQGYYESKSDRIFIKNIK